jgi:hypothetical protein
MTAKYYIPETQDFHKGFEFEWFQNEFEKLTFAITTDDDLDIIDDEIREGKIRVKCLDKEDIESLGWIQNNNIDSFSINGFDLLFSKNNWITIYEDKGADEYSYRGYIKNKSELKKIMIQTGILEK